MSYQTFINYRRLDTEAEAGRLLTTLETAIGGASTFLDTTALSAGTRWPDEIRDTLAATDNVLVLIGPDWLRAGADEFGQRRIDLSSDWVRLEIETALDLGKRIIPLLVRDGKMPPPEVLPPSIRPLTSIQFLEIRAAYWDHDVKLLIQQLDARPNIEPIDERAWEPYPKPPPVDFAVPVTEAHLRDALEGPIKGWEVRESPLPENLLVSRRELFREYKFATFQDAVAFMNMLAPGCDIANHHPRWENIWRTLRVYLSTWNIGHAISDRDIQLAKYFDSAYESFPGRHPHP
jgi:pterin-4a-carbinolamine dehydratase